MAAFTARKGSNVPSFDFSLREPRTRDEILSQLRELHDVSSEFWNSFATEAFFAPVGHGWSPAGNIRHLNKAMQPLARALNLPRILLRVLFGKAGRPSRTYAGVRDTYRAILQKGGGAGSFAPEAADLLGKNEADRARLMAIRETTTNSLLTAIDRWPDETLDRYRLPHPLLGKLTVREMLLFTVYHNYHHVRSVATRLSEPQTQASPTSARQ
jgi:DinB superfamily